MDISISNRELASILLKSPNKNSDVILEYVRKEYDTGNGSQSDCKGLKTKLDRHFIPTFKHKLKAAAYSEDRFSKLNATWLDNSFTFKFNGSNQKTPKSYAHVSQSTKKRKIQKVLEDIPPKDLFDACEKRLSFPSERETSHNSNVETEDTNPLSPDEALAMFLDAKLTKSQYSIIRKTLLAKNIDVLPAYRHITNAKSSCCPEFDVTETSASTKLQSLLDHTAQRILEIDDVKESVLDRQKPNLELIVKYGCDGTSGFTQYKQAFSEARSGEGNSVFMICMVPLFLRFSDGGHENIIFWQNKYASSTKLCRPIKFVFKKESSDVIKSEMQDIESQANKLIPAKIVVEGHEVFVNFTLHCTMLDGKVRQVLTDTISSQRCSICECTPKEMNKLDIVLQKPPKTAAYKFGLSTLHAWIRNMEWVLHLSYKVLANVRKYNEKLTTEEKAMIQAKKNEVIDGIKEALGILVDSVKQSAGNTNDGNTARKFFQNWNKVAVITGIKEEFIKRLYIILQTVASKHCINVDVFREYCLQTVRLYIANYPWYPMPSCHALLIHVPDVIDAFTMPIGLLSEVNQ